MLTSVKRILGLRTCGCKLLTLLTEVKIDINSLCALENDGSHSSFAKEMCTAQLTNQKQPAKTAAAVIEEQQD